MSFTRGLNADRMTSIKNCQAKGGPLYCRYHSGVVNDCFAKIKAISVKDDVSSEQYDSCLNDLEDNINQLLEVYTYENEEKRFSKNKPFMLHNGKRLETDDIVDIRNSLHHIKEALANGDYNGKTLGTCVSDFNSLVEVPLERIISSDEENNYNVSIRGIIESNPVLEKKVPELSDEIHTDGSLDINEILSTQEQREVTQWLQNKLSQISYLNSKKYDAYLAFNKTLSEFYPPVNNSYRFNRRMNKGDAKEYWSYITKKYPILDEQYTRIMKKNVPTTPDELEQFSNAIVYEPSKLASHNNQLGEISKALVVDGLPPAGLLLATRVYEQEQNKTSEQYHTKSSSQEDIETKLGEEIFTKLFTGKQPRTANELLHQMRALSINWDAHKILNAVKDTNGIPLQQKYDIDIDSTKRTVQKDGTLQYDITIHSDRYADMSDDSRYWGTDKISTLSILFDNKTPQKEPTITITPQPRPRRRFY